MTSSELEAKRLVYHQTAQRLAEAMKIVAYDATVSTGTKMNMVAEIAKVLPNLRRLMVIIQTEEVNRK